MNFCDETCLSILFLISLEIYNILIKFLYILPFWLLIN